MARFNFLNSLICIVASCGVIPAATHTANQSASAPKMPFSFVENRGQADASVRAVGSGPSFKAWFEDNGVLLQQGGATVNLNFAGALPRPTVSLADPSGAHANFLRGGDPTQWHTNIPMFSAVRYADVWPGVAMVFKEDHSHLEVEYDLAAGANLNDIRLHFNGDASVESDGSLLVRSATGEFREQKPVFYQETASARTIVTGAYVRTADGFVTFRADYDHSRALVIDPTIQFSGFFGGTGQDNITAVAVSPSYNVIVAGWTTALDLPTTNGVHKSSSGGVDAFVANFSPVNGALVWCTYLGGSGDDRAFGVATDSSNNTYVTGWTSSANFPVMGGVQTHLNGTRDAFVTKLNPAGNAMVYSTYLGGSGVDYANAIAVDSLGEAVIVGDTTSANLPVTAGVVQRTLAGGQDAFVARLSANGAALSFLTYFGGNSTDHGAALAIDPSGPIVIGGATNSINLPVQAALQAANGGGQDGFVAKLNATATAFVFSTYLGGSSGFAGQPEEVNAVVIGPSKNVLVAGTTSSANFPITANAYQTSFGGGQTDGFVTKINTNTGALMASTFLGSTMNDGINAMAGDSLGRLYVTGYTIATDYPVVHPTQAASGGGSAGSMDAFVTIVNSSLNAVPYSTYLGGSGSDSGNAIAVDPMTSIIIGGETGSPDFPVSGAVGTIMTESITSFVTKFAPDWTLEVASGATVTVDKWHDAGSSGGVANSAVYTYGQAGDIAIAGDWTGSGVKRIGIFRNGLWILDTNNSGTLDAGDKIVSFGQAGDIPVLGDWTGSGAIKLGLYRAGTFILDLSGHLSGVATGYSDATFSFGLSSDIPVVGDWNNTGTSKVGVFRAGQWLIDYNGDHLLNTLDKVYTYGTAGDIPVVGSWDSSGLTRIGVYRNGNWILNLSGTNVMNVLGQTDLYIPFGLPGQTPVVH